MIPDEYRAAFKRWGTIADADAPKQRVPNGATLLAKIAYVETRFSKNLGITSSAGAKAPMQFMPETRQGYIDQYGVDPWASVDDAVHAAAIFMRESGLDGYTPGSSTYISEVLKAPVSISGQAKSAPDSPRRRSRAPEGGSSDMAGGLMRFLVTAALVLGGVVMVGTGTIRAMGGRTPAEVEG